MALDDSVRGLCIDNSIRNGVHLTLDNDISQLGRFQTFPRVSAFDGTTDIEYLKNLSGVAQTTKLYAKRDDCNNLAFGGNKVRQVEYYFGDALAQGADTVLITGATQSNFVRTVAALAAKIGLHCHVQLESRVANDAACYHSSGNVLLDHLFGATVHHYGEGEDEQGADARLYEIADDLKSQGRRPYVIPLSPGHQPFGALGYVRAALELNAQLVQLNLKIDEIFVASGSGSTHAGLLFGLRALAMTTTVVGVCVRRSSTLQRERILQRCDDIADLLECESNVTEDDIVVDDGYFAPGYGQASAAVWDSIILAARKEALVLDPTYSGKTMAAFLERARSQDAPGTMLFIHTGGTPGVFGHLDQFEQVLSQSVP